MSQVTQILQDIEKGNPKAAEELLPLVYQELRKLARIKMSKEPPGQTLQATALVHEAYLRLVENQDHPNKWHGSGHFFAAAAEAMRRILVEKARYKATLKRGENQQKAELDEIQIPQPATDENILLMDEALQILADQDPMKAEIVKLRFFVGLTNEETARVVGLSEPTVKRYWAYSRAWLFRHIQKNK